jgi:ABC-type multidrug transport system fused ATPase/permease subunit
MLDPAGPLDDGIQPRRDRVGAMAGGASRRFGQSSRIALRLAPHATRRILLMAVTAVLTGFGEASLLYLIVRSATALAAGERHFSVHVAFLDLEDVSRTQVGVIAGGLLCFLLAVSAVNAWLTSALTSEATRNSRVQVVAAFLEASWARQAREAPSRMVELAAVNTSQLNSSLQATTIAVTSGLNFAMYLLIAILLNPFAFAALVVGAGAISLVLRPLRGAIRRLSKSNLAVGKRFYRQVSEIATTAREIRAFGVPAAVLGRTAAIAGEGAHLQRRLRLLSRLQPVVYQYLALGLVVVGLQVAGGASRGTVTELGAVVVLLVRSLSYTQQLNTALQSLNEAHPYLEELVGALDDLEAHQEHRGERELPDGRDLVVDGVSYRYEDGPLILRDVTMRAAAGECIGMVGRSGSGKSTLVQILLRLRAPTTGAVTMGAVPAREVRAELWHQAVAFVPQDNLLIAGTVAENIAFFRPTTQEEVVQAARRAHLHDDIAALPDGYATLLGAGARDLSGGQRQRLGLARALLGAPDVIILDEPTSALDMRSEELVQETLQELHGAVTLVIVAHRISTMAICDRIVVLEEGRIKAEGRPEELEKTSEFYAEALRLARQGVR